MPFGENASAYTSAVQPKSDDFRVGSPSPQLNTYTVWAESTYENMSELCDIASGVLN